MVRPENLGAALANNHGPCITTPNTKKATPATAKSTPLAKSKGVDKYGFLLSGSRSFCAAMYGKAGGATTAAVKAATAKQFGADKGYPRLNMLRKLNATSKKWAVVTTAHFLLVAFNFRSMLRRG